LAEDAHIRILDVTPVATQMNRDAVSARLFGSHSSSDNAWLGRASRLAYGSYVIDVYV
jgi:hypothetical protein